MQTVQQIKKSIDETKRPEQVEIDVEDIKRFYEIFIGGDAVHLTAIHCEGEMPLVGGRFTDINEILEFVIDYNNKAYNIYFTVNIPRAIKRPKPSKKDIKQLRAMWADLDPNKSADLDSERDRIYNVINEVQAECPPSAIIDTGNGFSLFWSFKKRLTANEENVLQFEALGKQVAKNLTGDHVQNIDRVMRLPGTINHPTPIKVQAGYKKSQARIIELSPEQYTLHQLNKYFKTEPLPGDPEDRTKLSREHPVLSVRVQHWLKWDSHIKTLWSGGPTSTQKDESRSGFDMTLLACLKARGATRKEAFAALLLFDYGKLPEESDEYFLRMWNASVAKPPANNFTSGNELIERYAFVRDQDKIYDAKSNILMSRASFDHSMLREFPGNRQIPRASIALAHDPSSIVVDSLTWEPCNERILERHGRKLINLYSVPTMEPMDGDVDVWIDHLEFVIGNHDQVEHLIDWLAFNIQYPNIKINHQILLAGNPRIGKDILFLPIIRYFGPNNVSHPQGEDLHSNFNEYLNGKKLVMVEEIMNFERKELENRLKPLCANPPEYLHINSKGVKQYEIPNVVSLIFLSNKPNAISISDTGDSRYYCMWSNAKRRSDQYYTDYIKWINTDGCQKVIGYLMKRNLKKFNPGGGAPETDYTKEIRYFSKTSSAMTMLEKIGAHEHPFTCDLVTGEDVLDSGREDGLKNRRDAALKLKEIGAVRRELTYSRDGRMRKIYLWAIRNQTKWEDAENTEWVREWEDSI